MRPYVLVHASGNDGGGDGSGGGGDGCGGGGDGTGGGGDGTGGGGDGTGGGGDGGGSTGGVLGGGGEGGSEGGSKLTLAVTCGWYSKSLSTSVAPPNGACARHSAYGATSPDSVTVTDRSDASAPPWPCDT